MRKTIFLCFLLASVFLFPKGILAYSNSDVLSAVNSTRSDYSKKSFAENQQLNQAAAAKLVDMQKYSYWSHNNPVTEKNWLSFVREFGFNGGAGENLAKGFSDTHKIIEAWLNSPTHKKNLLSDDFETVGIAVGEVTYSSGPKKVVVLIFGKEKKFFSFWENLFSNRKIASI